jgi:hypothetical protein
MPHMWRMWSPIFVAYDLLRYIGLRDRLRCPSCRAVGTFKPHGGMADRRQGDLRGERRWLCKWCGFYIGPEGVLRAWPHPVQRVWVLPEPYYADVGEPGPTPADVISAEMGRTWPWRG